MKSVELLVVMGMRPLMSRLSQDRVFEESEPSQDHDYKSKFHAHDLVLPLR